MEFIRKKKGEQYDKELKQVRKFYPSVTAIIYKEYTKKGKCTGIKVATPETESKEMIIISSGLENLEEGTKRIIYED